MIVYTLPEIKAIESNILKNIDERINKESLKKINAIATRVGAPTYSRTPVFEKKKKDNIRNKDWEYLRNFKETKLEKKEGIDGKIDDIRLNLNKITDKTYGNIYKIIFDIIKDITSKNDLEKIGEAIFDIGSNNVFWSELYAKLYNQLIDEFPIMKVICYKNFITFKDILLNIRYCDSSKDYDLFCEINKENSKRKGLSKFLSICAKYSIIEQSNMIEIINGLISYIEININDSDKQNQMEEIVENLFILIDNCKDFINKDVFTDIHQKLDYFANLNIKEYKSLSNKIIFKLMDIIDIINDVIE